MLLMGRWATHSGKHKYFPSSESATGTKPTAAADYDFRTASDDGDTIEFADGTTTTKSGSTNYSLDSTNGVTQGTGTYVNIPAFNYPTSWTIEIYFKASSLGAWSEVFASWDGGENAGASATNVIRIERRNADKRFHFLAGIRDNLVTGPPHLGMYVSLGDKYVEGLWYHLIWAHEGVGHKNTWFLDGVPLDYEFTTQSFVQAENIATHPDVPNGTRGINRIGRGNYNSGDTGIESCRFIRFYNKHITPTEASLLFLARDD